MDFHWKSEDLYVSTTNSSGFPYLPMENPHFSRRFRQNFPQIQPSVLPKTYTPPYYTYIPTLHPPGTSPDPLGRLPRAKLSPFCSEIMIFNGNLRIFDRRTLPHRAAAACFSHIHQSKTHLSLPDSAKKFQTFRHQSVPKRIHLRTIPIYPPYTPQVPPLTL